MIFECKDCGSRFPELRNCDWCGIDACRECMGKHLTAAHLDDIVDACSAPVDAASVAADKADARLHSKQGV